jgi:hypothetical protein
MGERAPRHIIEGGVNEGKFVDRPTSAKIDKSKQSIIKVMQIEDRLGLHNQMPQETIDPASAYWDIVRFAENGLDELWDNMQDIVDRTYTGWTQEDFQTLLVGLDDDPEVQRMKKGEKKEEKQEDIEGSTKEDGKKTEAKKGSFAAEFAEAAAAKAKKAEIAKRRNEALEQYARENDQ